MIVSHLHRFIYYGLPKTASTTLHTFFEAPEWSGDPSWVNGTQHSIDQFDDTDGYVKWTVVRNPYDRIVSLWQHRLIELSAQPDSLTLLDFLTERPQLGDFYSFPQVRYFRWVKPDVVLKYEEMPTCLKTLPFVITDLELPRLNTTKHSPFVDYYGVEEEAIVWDQEREDFDQFNYQRL